MNLSVCCRAWRRRSWSAATLILLLTLVIAAFPRPALASDEEGDCDNAPSCRIIPNVGTIEAIVGEPFSVTICGVSNCGNEVSIEGWHLNPDWCEPVYTDTALAGINPGEELCYDLICTPPITAAVGFGGNRTFKFKIKDLENGEYVWCEYTVHTTLPCISQPSCRTIPEGVIEVVAGESFSFEFCASSECTDHRFEILPVMVPSWCHPASGMMNTELDMPAGEHCFTVECNPPSDTPPDRYWIKIKVIDLETGLQETCVLDVDILEPPCDLDPACEISSGEGFRSNNDTESFEILAGETGGFQICGTSFCGNDITIDTSGLPDFCSVNNADGQPCGFCGGEGGHEGSHTECVWIDCEPDLGDVGQHHATIWVTDEGNDNRSRCDVWINVISPCEYENPTCEIVLMSGGESVGDDCHVQVGEPFSFKVCGETACDDHTARVAPSSLPPFITNPGHTTGAPGDEVCLTVHGEAGPLHIGIWNARFIVTDVQSGLTTECSKRIIVEGEPVCPDRPTCTVDTMSINATAGEMFSVEVCGAPVCEGHAVEIIGESIPDFCDPFATVTGDPDETVCATFECTVPSGVMPGSYELKFRVRDTTNSQSRLCTVQLNIAAPAVIGCFESDQPNDDITECSMFDAGDCFDIGCGSAINGSLDESGSDFDYYCVGGLEPGSEYTVTIIGGTQPDGMPGCYAIACLDLNGTILSSTNTGQTFGYPTITCVSDSSGFVYFAVSGCEDLNIDGNQDSRSDGDDSRGGIGHGSRGNYIMVVDFGDPFEVNHACDADMNGDGVVDSGDLGLLLGMFGQTCDR
ncbi:MAG: hypothetical protein H6814_11365 [Phycisphaeraceae bacterium]|nr:hypothetical protein [Phycisphaeraceae bacterium]